MVGFILDFECDVEKRNTYDWKPEKVSKHLNFFHSCIFRVNSHNIRFWPHLAKSFFDVVPLYGYSGLTVVYLILITNFLTVS